MATPRAFPDNAVQAAKQGKRWEEREKTPGGRGYREGIPGFAGSQSGISLKGEAEDHKGNFDQEGGMGLQVHASCAWAGPGYPA
jgi:hypothetical protein